MAISTELAPLDGVIEGDTRIVKVRFKTYFDPNYRPNYSDPEEQIFIISIANLANDKEYQANLSGKEARYLAEHIIATLRTFGIE